ncbi:LysR family transcriptional regulator [Microbacterium kribbense]|uniref:LysR family transcriptional regulator n=1 Tax=Microbacterium kribbense TaxID=433645 RepID=A0ABP7G6V6_9MICO
MEARWLEAFIAVAEELHFGRAAQRLHMAQSPLSQTIRRLETSVDAILFDRNTRSVSLTPAGKALLPMAYRVLRDIALATAAAQAATGRIHGTVRIGFSGAFNHMTLPALARAIRRTMPDIDLELISRIHTGEGITKLRNGTLDIAFVGLPLGGARGVASRLISRVGMGAVVPEDHPLADEKSIRVAALADDDFLSMPLDGSSSMADELMRSCIASGFRPRVVQEITDPYMMLTFIAAGMGVSIVAEDLAPILPRGARWIPLSDQKIYMYHGIAWMADEHSAAVAAVLKLSEKVLPTPLESGAA